MRPASSTQPCRRTLLLSLGILVGCGMVKVGGPGMGSTGGSGATVDHLRRVAEEGLEPKRAESEATLRAAVLFAAAREGTAWGRLPLSLGAEIAKHRAAGAKVVIEPVGDTVSLRMSIDTMKAKAGSLTFEETMLTKKAFEELERFTDKVRVEAVLRHLDVLLTMLSWRRDGGALGDEEVEAFRRMLEIARAVDAQSALGVTSLALSQAVVSGKAKPEALDAFLAKTAGAFPIKGGATAEETRALYEALPGSLEAAIEEMKRVTRERLPGPFKDDIANRLAGLFEPYVRMAKEAEGQTPAAAPSPSPAAEAAPASKGGGAAAAGLLEQGSALFPGLGVAMKGFEAAGALVEGKPDKAIGVAVSMVPGGTLALAIVQEAAKLFGV